MLLHRLILRNHCCQSFTHQFNLMHRTNLSLLQERRRPRLLRSRSQRALHKREARATCGYQPRRRWRRCVDREVPLGRWRDWGKAANCRPDDGRNLPTSKGYDRIQPESKNLKMSVKRKISLGELVNLVIDSLLVNCVEIWLSHSSSDSATSVITACDKHHYKSNGRILIYAKLHHVVEIAFFVPIALRWHQGCLQGNRAGRDDTGRRRKHRRGGTTAKNKDRTEISLL